MNFVISASQMLDSLSLTCPKLVVFSKDTDVIIFLRTALKKIDVKETKACSEIFHMLYKATYIKLLPFDAAIYLYVKESCTSIKFKA